VGPVKNVSDVYDILNNAAESAGWTDAEVTNVMARFIADHCVETPALGVSFRNFVGVAAEHSAYAQDEDDLDDDFEDEDDEDDDEDDLDDDPGIDLDEIVEDDDLDDDDLDEDDLDEDDEDDDEL
jgi:hypothetical protein